MKEEHVATDSQKNQYQKVQMSLKGLALQIKHQKEAIKVCEDTTDEKWR